MAEPSVAWLEITVLWFSVKAQEQPLRCFLCLIDAEPSKICFLWVKLNSLRTRKEMIFLNISFAAESSPCFASSCMY